MSLDLLELSEMLPNRVDALAQIFSYASVIVSRSRRGVDPPVCIAFGQPFTNRYNIRPIRSRKMARDIHSNGL